jgi:hypothetical protein
VLTSNLINFLISSEPAKSFIFFYHRFGICMLARDASMNENNIDMVKYTLHHCTKHLFAPSI